MLLTREFAFPGFGRPVVGLEASGLSGGSRFLAPAQSRLNGGDLRPLCGNQASGRLEFIHVRSGSRWRCGAVRCRRCEAGISARSSDAGRRSSERGFLSVRNRGWPIERPGDEFIHQFVQAGLPAQVPRLRTQAITGVSTTPAQLPALVVGDEPMVGELFFSAANITRDGLADHRFSPLLCYVSLVFGRA